MISGDVLFVPSGCPHRVENLTQSVAISANFVDPSNLQTVVEEVEIAALIDPRSADLLTQLTYKCAPILKDISHCMDKTDTKDKSNSDFKGCDKATKELLECHSVKHWIQYVTNEGHLKWNKFKH